jgi:hypothetical protein
MQDIRPKRQAAPFNAPLYYEKDEIKEEDKRKKEDGRKSGRG